MHSVAETKVFSRRADALLTQHQRMELIATLASDPLAGDVVPGLGGDSQAEVRRRWTGQERRVPSDLPILAMLIYGKNEQSNPTSEQRRALLAAVDELKTAARGGPA